MFRKIKKTAVSLVMLLCIMLSISAVASAAGIPGIAVKIGGSDVTLNLYSDRGRAYAPYEELFKAMGATASYDSANETITAVSGDTTVVFTLDERELTVTTKTQSQTNYINAKPYKDESGTIYIPVRYAAQALGYVVAWDEASKTITLQSIDDLIAQSGATYTVVDKYLAFQKEFAAKKHAVSGSFDLSLKMPSEDAASAIPPLTASGTVSGLINQADLELRLKMKSNISAFIASLDTEETMDAASLQMLAMLDDFEIKVILNSQMSMAYLQSPLLTKALGLDKSPWLSLDLGELTSGTSLSALNGGVPDSASFKEYLSSILKDLNLLDTGISSFPIKEALDGINSILSDQAFVKEGDNYVSSITSDLGEDASGLTGKATLKLTFKYTGTVYNGLAVDLSLTADNEILSLNYTTDATNSCSLKVLLDLPDIVTLDMTASFTYTDTTETPAAQPPAGSTIISADDLMGSTFDSEF